MKFLFLSVVVLLLCSTCYAQWTRKDSLELKESLRGDREVKLNKEAVKLINLNSGTVSPLLFDEKPWMRYDGSLPAIITPSAIVEADSANVRNRMAGKRLPYHTLRKFRVLPLDTLETTMNMKLPPPEGISLGHGIRVQGGLFFGLDILQIFTKDFWEFKKKRRRASTVRALHEYSK